MVSDPDKVAGEPVIDRTGEALPIELLRSGDIPDNLDPLSDGVLMKHQADWIADKSDLKAAEKGRRTGITFAEALDAALIASASRKAGGSNYFYIGDTKDKGREFIGYVAHFAKTVSKELANIEEFLFEDKNENGDTKYISAYRVTFASGFRVEALSSNPANIRGLQGVVCIDEAAFHKNVREVLDAVTALLIWGGKVRVISTHNGVLNPFNELIKEANAGRIPFSVHHIPFSLAIENGLFKRVCYIKGKKWSAQAEAEWEAMIRGAYGTRKAAMRQELDAIPAESEGAALTGVQIEAAMIDGVPIIVCEKDDDFKNEPEHVRQAEIAEFCERELKPVLARLNIARSHCFGHDFGRSGDQSSFDLKEIGTDLIRRGKLIVEMDNVPFEQQKQILWYILRRVPKLRAGAMDAGGNGAWLAEVTMQEFGSKILEVKFTQEWYRLEMPHYVRGIEEQTILLARHDDVLMDHRSLQYVNGIIRVPDDFRFRGSDGRQRHGDNAIAGALCEFAARQDTYAYEGYQSSRDATNRDDDDDFEEKDRGRDDFRRHGGVW